MPETAAPDQADVSLDLSPDMAMTSLFGAAIGPINRAYYLPIFSRFEAAGEATLSWNGSAGLYTLNWMLFRGLWGAALAFVGAMVGLPLLLLALGSLVFDWPQELIYELLLTCLVLACGVSGAWGNALLYNHSRRAMMAAIEANSTLAQACAQLSQQASSRQRFIRILLGNALLLALAALAYVLLPDGAPAPAPQAAPVSVSGSVALPASAPQQASSAALAPASALSAAALSQAAGLAAAAASSASTSAVSAAAASGDATAPLASASASAAAAASASAAASAPGSTVSATRITNAPTQEVDNPGAALILAAYVTRAAAAPATPPAMPASSGTSASVQAAASAVQVTAQKMPASATQPKSAQPAASKASRPSAASAAKTGASAAAPGQGFLINAGLFAKADNAQKVVAKLEAAGLPAHSQELQTSQGPRTRVRVGPFAKRRQALAALERIHALKLDAALVKP